MEIELCGEATWDFGSEFFIEDPENGNFVFSSPDYGGNGKVRRFSGSYADWIGEGSIGRSKGVWHSVFELEEES
jgi:hypothetical protein